MQPLPVWLKAMVALKNHKLATTIALTILEKDLLINHNGINIFSKVIIKLPTTIITEKKMS